MDISLVSIPLVFIAGILSFLSPCVLPLVPVYIGHLVGTTHIAAQQRATVMAHALAFVSGFTAVFVTLGALVGVLNRLLPPGYKEIMAQIGGILLIILGLHVIGIIRIPFLYQEKRFELNRERGISYPASFLIGMTFAAGWTPCIGPILGSILGLAYVVSAENIAISALMLLIYSAGLAVPFLAAAAAWQQVSARLKQMYKYMNTVTRVSGVLLIAMGIVLLTGTLNLLNSQAGSNDIIAGLNGIVISIEEWLTQRFGTAS